MDSMRSLKSSLPRSSAPRKDDTEPPQQLLSAFKAAALSVTKLYKTAASDQARARSEGYQDALDELLTFLDKEDIGLNDGEGWKVRRWATERLDGRDSMSLSSDDEPSEKVDRGSSPAAQRTQSSAPAQPASTMDRTSSPARSSPMRTELSAPPATTPSDLSAVPQSAFSFRSSHQYPQETEMTLSGLDISENSRTQNQDSEDSILPSPQITISRSSRNQLRHNHASRLNARPSSTAQINAMNAIGRGAGQKRKINYNDFFDVGNLGNGRDRDGSGGGGGGGGKRGRHA